MVEQGLQIINVFLPRCHLASSPKPTIWMLTFQSTTLPVCKTLHDYTTEKQIYKASFRPRKLKKIMKNNIY